MEPPLQPKGRGRGRGRTLGQEASSSPVGTRASVQPQRIDNAEPINIAPMTASRGRGARLRQRLNVSDEKWKVSELTLGEFKSNTRPSKPMELGKIGEEIEVMVNYFPVIGFPREGRVYQYDIQIENKKKSKLQREHRRTLYKCWLEQFHRQNPQFNKFRIVYDNEKTILTYRQPLPNIDTIGVMMKIMGLNRVQCMEEYQITIKQVGEPLDLRSLSSLEGFYENKDDNSTGESHNLQSIRQVLSIVFHEYYSTHTDYIYNRSFYKQPVGKNDHGYWDLGLGKALWRGFYSCLVFSNGNHRLLMNLDVSHAVFMTKQRFVDFLCSIMGRSPSGRKRYPRDEGFKKVEMQEVLQFLDWNTNPNYDGELEFILKCCTHLSVSSQVANQVKSYQIQDLGNASSTQTFLWNRNKKTKLMTVEQYYKEQYGLDLKYPTLPTLKMRGGSFIPMEFVSMEPVKVKRITDEQRALLCLKSTLNPSQYRQSIENIRRDPTQQNSHQDPFIAAWNGEIDVNMLIVPVRILPAPSIVYNGSFEVKPQLSRKRGVWSSTQNHFQQPKDFPPVWALINLLSSLNQQSCERFYEELQIAAAGKGMKCPVPIYREYDVQPDSIVQLMRAITEMMKENVDCKFFIVILPDDNDAFRDQVYGDLKKLCEIESGFGIVTQMIRKKKTDLWNTSKLNNILMKINTKLDGTNFILHVDECITQFFSRGHRYMYVGIDLSHMTSGVNGRRSTVAVVASADDIPNRYFKEIYVQERPYEARNESREYVVDMKAIMKSLISQYEKKHGYPPAAIVIYRDGIAESEFDSVFEKELMAIREACVELASVYRPYLTYIVVSKNHHMRPLPPRGETNVPAGTVIDSHDVTRPMLYDFFLCSHHGEKGTSRLTHYYVLYDDNKLKPDEVYSLTYALCYTYARCTRSISIPAPVKYADLLAFRARFYIDPNESLDTESTIPLDTEVDVNNTIKSKRIVLSPKLQADCPFFL